MQKFGLNWTKVGLKVREVYGAIRAQYGLNWTKVGLKDQTEQDVLASLEGLNWTKVGLKVRRRRRSRRPCYPFELD